MSVPVIISLLCWWSSTKKRFVRGWCPFLFSWKNVNISFKNHFLRFSLLRLYFNNTFKHTHILLAIFMNSNMNTGILIVTRFINRLTSYHCKPQALVIITFPRKLQYVRNYRFWSHIIRWLLKNGSSTKAVISFCKIIVCLRQNLISMAERLFYSTREYIRCIFKKFIGSN